MSKFGQCEICNRDLEDYEKDLLDCGHYACNSCTYSKRVRTGMNIHQCSNCFEHIEMVEGEDLPAPTEE